MRSGGKYIIEDGKRRKVEGTTDHPEGNRARPAPTGPIHKPADPPKPSKGSGVPEAAIRTKGR